MSIQQLADDALECFRSGKMKPARGQFFSSENECCGAAAAMCQLIGIFSSNIQRKCDILTQLSSRYGLRMNELHAFISGFDGGKVYENEEAYKLGRKVYDDACALVAANSDQTT